MVCHDALNGIEEFFKTYEEQAGKLDEHRMEIEDELQQLDKKIAQIQKDLKEMKAQPQDITELRCAFRFRKSQYRWLTRLFCFVKLGSCPYCWKQSRMATLSCMFRMLCLMPVGVLNMM